MASPAAKSSTTSKPPQTKKEKKPRLTHFLALPLCTTTSRSQLQTSIARFADVVATLDSSAEARDNAERKFRVPRIGTQAIVEEGQGSQDEDSTNAKEDLATKALERVSWNEAAKESQGKEVSLEQEVGDTANERAQRKPEVKDEQEPAKDEKIPEAAIRKSGSLHFTLGVMSLETPERVEEAVEFLKGLHLSSMAREAVDELNLSSSHDSVTAAADMQEEGVADPNAVGDDNGGRVSTDAVTEAAEHDTEDVPVPTVPLQDTTTQAKLGEQRETENPFPSNKTSDPPPTIQQHHHQTSHHPFTLTLKGLKPLPTAKKATSLYAYPTPSQPLHLFAEKLRKSFADAGFLLPENRKLLLHATVVNTIYARKGGRKGVGKGGKGKGGKGKGGGRLVIDARGLVEEWRDVVWAEGMVVDRVAVCEMGAEKVYEEVVGDEEGVEAEGEEGVDQRTNGGRRKVVDEVYKEVAGMIIPWDDEENGRSSVRLRNI